MRSLIVAVTLVAPTVGLGVVGAGSAGAVGGTVAVTCVMQGTGLPSDHRTITYEAHAPDSVDPDVPFDVQVRFGYPVPSNAQVGGASLSIDRTGADTQNFFIDAPPGSSETAGTVKVLTGGAAGSVVEVRLHQLLAFTQVSGSAIAEICTPDHRLVLARVGVGVPLVSVGDAAVVEGSTGTRALEFAVTLSRPATTDVTVSYGTEDGTAIAGSDYVAKSGSVTIRAGDVSAGGIIVVRARGDRIVEPKENLRVRLRDPIGAVIGRGVGTGRIIDDDPERGPRLSIGDGSIVEGAGGVPSMRIVVSLSEPATQQVHFHYATVDGSAVAGADYRAQEFDYLISPGFTSTSIPVPVIADGTAEPNESFTVHLSSSDAPIQRANGVGTIIDDD